LPTQLVVRGRIARRILEEAGRLGVSPEEYLLELITQGLDPGGEGCGVHQSR